MMNTDVVEDGLEPGARVGHRYRIVDVHRAHPIGELYQCVDETCDETRLLQRLRPEFSVPAIRARLFETRGDAALESPEIDDLLDYGEDLDGRLYLVTACRPEPSLDVVERPLGFEEAVALLARVARALAPLHAKHLVHGAIEPSNLLVDGERELVSLLDFGLVPALDGEGEASKSPTKVMPMLVSPHYAPPELIRGDALGPAADIYALGVLAWELLFGRAPYRGPTLKVFDGHLNRPLPAFERPFDMPVSFEWILRRMLAKNPVDRFADAGQVLAELETYLEAPELSISGPCVTIEDEDFDEADDDGETVLYERTESELRSTEPDSIEAQIIEFEQRLPRRRRGARWLAAACAMSCVGLLAFIGLGELDNPRAASETPHDASAQAQIQTAEHEAQTEPSPAAVMAAPKAAIATPPVESLPNIEEVAVPRRHGLVDSSFRAKKGELYRRVDFRCVEGSVRRTVKVAVRVGPAGEVEAATTMGGMGKTKLGGCVARQARKLEFPETVEGGFYVYTVRIR